MVNDLRGILTCWILNLAMNTAPDDGFKAELCKVLLQLDLKHMQGK